MCNRIIVFLLLQFVAIASLFSQPFTTKTLEDSSYHYYLSAQHDKQIKLIKTAYQFDMDYYYLRLRMGIAYMGKGDYKTAIYHFNKARKLNLYGKDAIPYVRDCALAMGMENLDRYTKKKMDVPVGFLKMAYLESGSKLSSFSDTIGNTYYGHFGMQFALGSKFTSYQAYSFTYQNTFPLNVRQHQYYTHLAYKPSINWQFNANYSILIANIQLNTNDSVYNGTNYIMGLSVLKHHKKIDISLNASYSYLNSLEQYQAGLGIVYYPFGNDKLQLRVHLNGQKQDSIITPIIIPSATVKLFRNCWIKGEYIVANTSNFVEQDAFISNNNPDKTIDKTSLLLNYKFNHRNDLYLVCQYERKEVDSEDKPAKPYEFRNIILGYSIKF
jgi:tetratricopeptide (TPR) repeat protein